MIQFLISDVPELSLAAGIEEIACRIPGATSIEQPAIEFLVDREVAETSGGQNADTRLSGKAAHGLRNRPAERVAALRPRLVGREIGIQRDRHDRDDRVRHQPAMHKAEGMAFAMRLAQALGVADVEVGVR